MYLEKQKVTQYGPSLAVILRKMGIRDWDIQKGDTVIVTYHKNKIVITKGEK